MPLKSKMKAKLSHKDIVKLGKYEASQGFSLNKIESDFLKKGIDRHETIKALKEVDYYNKSNKMQNKSLFWLWFILLIAIGAVLYLFFSGTINLDWLHSINFK